MDYVFGWQGELGLKEYGSWNHYLNTTDCQLLDEDTPKILEAFRQFVKEYQIIPWDAKHQTGQARYVVIRRGCFTNERLVLFVVKDLEAITPLMREDLGRRLRELATSVLVGENPEITDLSYVKRYEVIQGNAVLTEEINGLRYRIHPNSFFQTNSFMAEKLQTHVLNTLGPVSGKTILDLYCGLGFFGIACARQGATVAGHELDAAAIELAHENAILNGVSERTHFSAGAVEAYAWEIDKPDLVIVDPPRSGLHPDALKILMEKAPPTIVYVSCNYPRLVGELKTLLTKYRLVHIEALDLFPQTPHVEVLVKLVRS
jgi:23S rRNA (uracil-5-)-methyltransferase RumA